MKKSSILDVGGILDRIFLPKEQSKEFNMAKYLRDLEKGRFRDFFNLGISEKDGGAWHLKNFVKEPNALYIGAMGSGKSKAADFTISTWLMANSDQTILFVIDPLKGATDYSLLMPYDQVHFVTNSEQNIHRVIDLVYDEVLARQALFTKVAADNIESYEKITKNKMARIIVLMEEFHAIPYAILNFDSEFKKSGTTAQKFHQIMRVGRSLGTWVVACSQKGTKSDIPSEMVPSFTQKQIFRVSKTEASYFLGEAKASEIGTAMKGRCETEEGTVQFPMIEDSVKEMLLDYYVEPLKAECAYLTQELISDYLGGKSPEELYKLKKLPDLISSMENKDHDLIIEIMHKKLDHVVERIDAGVDPFGIGLIVDWPRGGRVAVMTKVGKISPKHINKLMHGMKAYKCNRGILYTTQETIPSSYYKACVSNNIELVDFEDLKRLARQIESKINLEDIDPSKLADDSKEASLPETTLEEIMAEEEPYSEAVELDSDLNSKYIEKVEKPNIEEVEKLVEKTSDMKPIDTDDVATFKKLKTVKRKPVTGQFHLTRAESPELLIHLQRNENGEIYRALFSVLVNKIKRHQYFLDRQVEGRFSQEDKAKLGVETSEEWNNQFDEVNHRPIFSEEDFKKEILVYLENFRQLDIPSVKVIGWKEDKDLIEKYIEECPHVDKTVIAIEDYYKTAHGEDLDRENLLMRNVKPMKKVDIFSPAEKDFQVWRKVSE